MKKTMIMVVTMLVMLVVLTGCHERNSLVYVTEKTTATLEELNEACEGFEISADATAKLEGYYLDEESEKGATLYVTFVATQVDMKVDSEAAEKLRISKNTQVMSDTEFRFEGEGDYTVAFKEKVTFEGNEVESVKFQLKKPSRRSAK